MPGNKGMTACDKYGVLLSYVKIESLFDENFR